ncbi:hypothetical protein RW1_005_00930 [Rhodococcus wratislaviensis NBRC 100605]|uniref:Uncharacterized protein n=1 Tax=Rhodococcus wratislaviensis NBRC 100605 TaxID=1219028 RepID=X0PXE8_RHOWR|nr:hypothetical protein RW1_005_00930 [Rhodococcus wratislaviensis NBRC 100605]
MLAGLTDTAADDVVDLGGVDAVAFDDAAQHVREQFDRVRTGQRAARLALAGRETDDVDDHCRGRG